MAVDTFYLLEKREEIRSRMRREIGRRGSNFFMLRLNGIKGAMEGLRRLEGIAILDKVLNCAETDFPALKEILEKMVWKDLEELVVQETRDKVKDLHEQIRKFIERQEKECVKPSAA